MVSDRLTLLVFGLIVLIAGTNFVAVKFSNQELAPFWGAALRFFTASILFFLFMFIKQIPIPKGRSLTGAIIYGLIGFGIGYALAYWALLKVPAGIASVTIAFVPLITFFLALFHKLEKFQFRVLSGGLVAVLGIGVVFYEQLNASVPLFPLLALFGAALCFAETGIIVKLFPKTHIASMNSVGMLTGALLLFILSYVGSEAKVLPNRFDTQIAFFYLVIVGSAVFFALIVFILKRWTASAVSYQLVLAPIVTIIIANILRGETISPVSLTGSLIVIFGVYIGALTTTSRK